MLEAYVVSIMVETAIGGIILGVFLLKDHFDKKKINYAANAAKDVIADAVVKTEEMTQRMMDNVKKTTKEWMEEIN